jgi:hypothetical protein
MAASHYGRSSRGCWFPPIWLQETKTSVSRPFTLEARGYCSTKCSHGNIFLPRRRSLEGSFGWTRLEIQTMIKRPSMFLSKKQRTAKILAVRLEGLFWARSKVGCSFLRFGFGLWTWLLEASHCAWLKAPILIFCRLFQPISLDSQQSLAIQSHGLSTWTTIMWSGHSWISYNLLVNFHTVA